MRQKICVLIPCYNEEKGIAKVIEKIPLLKLNSLGFDTEIIVIDNNSKDNTAEIAKSTGAVVISEKKQGKGNAIIAGFNSIPNDCNIVVMIDGDNTYDTNEIIRLIEPIDSGFCEVVVGSRLNGKILNHSMSYFNRIGNWIFTFLVRTAYKGNVTDVCSGYFAWKKEVIDELLPNLKSSDYSIEMEMIIKMARMDYEMFSIPISYDKREGVSNLRPVIDGFKIMGTWVKYIFWKNPKLSRDKEIDYNKNINSSESIWDKLL